MVSRLISLSQVNEWRDAVASVPHGYWHTWQANESIYRGTGEFPYLFLHDDPATGCRAALAYVEREWDGSIDVYNPAGFGGFAASGPVPGALAAWREVALSRGYVCGYFALHPIACPEELRGASTSRTNELFVIDLRKEPGRLFAGFDADTRRRLARKSSSETALLTDRQILSAFLLEQYEPFMRAMGARSRSIWPKPMLESLCKDPAIQLYGSSDDFGVCSVSVFGVTPLCAEYLASVRVRGGQARSSFLMAAAIRRFAEGRVKWLNLGGGVAEGDSIARSKRRYGPVGVPLLVSKEIYQPKAYQALMRRAGLQDSFEGDFFPSYRISKS